MDNTSSITVVEELTDVKRGVVCYAMEEPEYDLGFRFVARFKVTRGETIFNIYINYLYNWKRPNESYCSDSEDEECEEDDEDKYEECDPYAETDVEASWPGCRESMTIRKRGIGHPPPFEWWESKKMSRMVAACAEHEELAEPLSACFDLLREMNYLPLPEE